MAVRTPAHILQPAIVLVGALACVLLGRTGQLPAAAVIPTQISQVPLTIAVPAHPQVVLAIGNSESMDGNLSGAIMTGSGSLNPALSLDVTGDGKLDLSDVPSSGNMPVGMLLGPVYASTPTLMPSGSVTAGTRKLTSVSSGSVDSVLDRGRAKQRISWWEVR